MLTRAASSTKRVREEVLIDSKPKKRARNAYCKRLATSSQHAMQTRSKKGARHEQETNCDKRPRLAEEKPLARDLGSEETASKGSEPAARGCKRPYSPSQAAGDFKAVSEEAPSALQQVGAYWFHLSLSHFTYISTAFFRNLEKCSCSASQYFSKASTCWQMVCTKSLRDCQVAAPLVKGAVHLLVHCILLKAAISSELMILTHLPLQEVETVVPENSAAQSEEEQLHPLSKRQKHSEEREATSALQQVSKHLILLDGLQQSMHFVLLVFCTYRTLAGLPTSPPQECQDNGKCCAWVSLRTLQLQLVRSNTAAHFCLHGSSFPNAKVLIELMEFE